MYIPTFSLTKIILIVSYQYYLFGWSSDHIHRFVSAIVVLTTDNAHSAEFRYWLPRCLCLLLLLCLSQINHIERCSLCVSCFDIHYPTLILFLIESGALFLNKTLDPEIKIYHKELSEDLQANVISTFFKLVAHQFIERERWAAQLKWLTSIGYFYLKIEPLSLLDWVRISF